MDDSRWKSSDELPPFKILAPKFDVARLREDYLKLAVTDDYTGYGRAHADLLKNYGGLGDSGELRDELKDETYRTLPITYFDETFDLSQRLELSGTIWDRRNPFKNPKADERYYRRRREGLPEYLAFVLDTFGPSVHRCRFAMLKPGSKLTEHVDYDARYSIRVAIPVFTYPGCKSYFRLKDKSVVATEFEDNGSSYFINSGIPHWADNPTERDRIFLILSIDSQKALSDV